MVFCTCPKCGAKLKVEENDTIPGCREMEEVFLSCLLRRSDKGFF